MSKKVVKKKRRKPWIAAVALIAALGMLFSVYLSALNPGGPVAEEQGENGHSQVEQLLHEAENLENHIEQYEPNSVVLQNLANIYIQLNHYVMMEEVELADDDYLGKAAAVMEKAVELEPENSKNYVFLFEIYQQAGDEEKAEEYAQIAEDIIQEILDEDPGDNDARYQYAVLLQSYHGDFAAAHEQMEEILETEPEGSELYNIVKQQMETTTTQEIELE